MTDGHLASIATHFGHLTDPRMERTKDHQLLDILTICPADRTSRNLEANFPHQFRAPAFPTRVFQSICQP